MARKSQNKGASGEREVINLLNERLNTSLERNPYRQQKEAGHYDVVGLDWLALEVKRYKTASQAQVNGWFTEAIMQAHADQLPVLAYRADRQDWRFVVPFNFLQHGFGGYPCRNQYDHEPVELHLRGFCALLKRNVMDYPPTEDLLK